MSADKAVLLPLIGQLNHTKNPTIDCLTRRIKQPAPLSLFGSQSLLIPSVGPNRKSKEK